MVSRSFRNKSKAFSLLNELQAYLQANVMGDFKHIKGKFLRVPDRFLGTTF